VLLASLIYVIPIIIGNLPQPWNDRLGSVMIGALTREITGDMITSSAYRALLCGCRRAPGLRGATTDTRRRLAGAQERCVT